MERIAVFAGSFDPWTLGHQDVVARGASLFDKIIVLVARNEQKRALFPEDLRVLFAQKALAEFSHVSVFADGCLTVDFMRRVGAKYLLRGIRTSLDLEWERSIAWNNRKLYSEAETVFLSSSPEFFSLSSSLVREFIGRGVSLEGFVPSTISKLVFEEGKRILCLE